MLPPSKGTIVFDPELCTGCQLCRAVCSFVKEGGIRPELSRIRLHTDPFAGTVENYVPQPCLQCDVPRCMSACPVQGAIYIHEKTGARVIDESKCRQGCSICINACGEHIQPPRIGIHPEKGIGIKCDLCDGAPECVKWCPNGALKYISRDEFVATGAEHRQHFTEAVEKDFGAGFKAFEGVKCRYKK